jgi:hypothetical protein
MESAMKPATALMALLLGSLVILFAAPSWAGDVSQTAPAPRSEIWRAGAPYSHIPPFPRSKRSASVWASDACWNGCQSTCTWGMADCLQHDAQGRCLKFTDHCDRSCQRECRGWGGPLVPDIFDF